MQKRNLLVLGFLALQLGLPLSYYLDDDPYDERFAMGPLLASSLRPVALNHPHCAKFCVLGGGSCSA